MQLGILCISPCNHSIMIGDKLEACSNNCTPMRPSEHMTFHFSSSECRNRLYGQNSFSIILSNSFLSPNTRRDDIAMRLRSHSRILRAAPTLRRTPLQTVLGVVQLARFAMQAILGANLYFLPYLLIDTGRAISGLRCRKTHHANGLLRRCILAS